MICRYHDNESWESIRELFRLIGWAFCPPDPNLLLKREDAPGKYSDFSKNVSDPLPDSYQLWIGELEQRFDKEQGRVKQIEQKANTLLTQNALVISLIAIAISFFLSKTSLISLGWLKIAITATTFWIVLCFCCAILWSRNAIVLHFNFPNPDYTKSSDDFTKPQVEKDRDLIVNLLYCIEHWTYYADAKATRVRIAHDFLRLGFLWLMYLLGIILFSLIVSECISLFFIYENSHVVM